MTAITAPVVSAPVASIRSTGISPRIVKAAAAIRFAARELDALFAGAATAPTREVSTQLALLRVNR